MRAPQSDRGRRATHPFFGLLSRPPVSNSIQDFGKLESCSEKSQEKQVVAVKAPLDQCQRKVNPLPASLCNCLLTCAHCTALCTSVVRLLQFAPLSCLHSGLQAECALVLDSQQVLIVEGPEQFERGPAFQ
jgi:hypothetical protein